MVASGKMNPDLLTEYRAATEAVAIADLSARGRLRVTGADATRFLQGQFTNDIAALKAGQGCYAALCNAKGKMRGDAIIYRLADSYLLDVEAGQAESIRVGLERFIIADDVQVTDVSGEFKQFLVIGPQAKKLIAKILPDVVLPTESYRFVEMGGGILARSLRWSTLSNDFWPPISRASIVWKTLEENASLLSVEALDVLRIEAGIPRYGVDMDENTIPIEAGIESRAISYTKGCYIGQEVIARIHSGGHVNQNLVGAKISGDKVPARGEKLFHDGKETGVVTSACFSPKLNAPLALGYVRREISAVGTKLEVSSATAEIIALPLNQCS